MFCCKLNLHKAGLTPMQGILCSEMVIAVIGRLVPCLLIGRPVADQVAKRIGTALEREQKAPSSSSVYL